jgi:hypothetical protein
MSVEPLPAGHKLADRFEILRLLGRGGFGLAYVARDLARRDEVVIKELAPEGSRRRTDGFLDLQSGGISPQLLRNRFADEANRLTKLHVRGVLPVRATVAENGTVYYATPYIAAAETLEQVLTREGKLPIELAHNVLLRLLDILEATHAQGVLHRDIKPSNILLTPDGEVILIDFGAAREFLADAHSTHTVMYTPGYAPPEQLSERARRGPFTDLYALSATAYNMLAGRPPEDAAERIAGEPLTSLHSLRPETPPALEATITQGLSLAYADRPQSAEEMRASIEMPPEETPVSTLEQLDLLLWRSRTFSYQKRACPACKDVLTEPKPLRLQQCPVCRRGMIRQRPIFADACPNCRVGPLRKLSNLPKLAICPECGGAPLQYRRKGLLKGGLTATCPCCNSSFDQDGDELMDKASEVAQTAGAWLEQLGRQPDFMFCKECGAQLDILEDGRWTMIQPVPTKFVTLYPDEWARVASGLDPGVGTAECDSCSADYYLDADKITLLAVHEDPFGYGEQFLGRITSRENVRWLAVGKESPHSGLVCERCGTELDKDGPYFRLVRTPNRLLSRRIGQPRTIEDWHRIAEGLPTIDQEPALAESLEVELRKAYRAGRYGFDEEGRIAWKGEAIFNSESRGMLLIDDQEISFGGRFRKRKMPIDAVVAAAGRAADLDLQFAGERESQRFEIEPVELTAQLQSGPISIDLDASDLAARLNP